MMITLMRDLSPRTPSDLRRLAIEKGRTPDEVDAVMAAWPIDFGTEMMADP